MPVLKFVSASGEEWEVDGVDGVSIMEHTQNHNIPGIDADCGGQAICGTCHCFIEQIDAMPPIEQQEEAMLTLKFDRAPNSRLACQIKVTDSMPDLVITLPEFQG